MDKYEKRRTALADLVDKLGWGGITRVASSIGKDPSYVSRMLYPEGKAGKKRIGEDSVESLNSAFPGWLDEDPHKLLKNAGFTPLPPKSPLVTIARYPTGGKMGDGGVILNDEVGAIESWQVSKRWVSENIRNYTAAENLCIVTGYGDSMRPTFNPGDPLIIDRGVKKVEFDAVYFFRIDSQGYIKRLQRIPTANGLVLSAISDNRKAYDPFPITENMNFEVIGRVLQIWRREDF